MAHALFQSTTMTGGALHRTSLRYAPTSAALSGECASERRRQANPSFSRRLTTAAAADGAAAATPGGAAAPATPADVKQATLRWVDQVVIGYNLCPFARAPRALDGIRCVVSTSTEFEPFFEEFKREALRLVQTYSEADDDYVVDDDGDYEEDEEEDDDAVAITAVAEVEHGAQAQKEVEDANEDEEAEAEAEANGRQEQLNRSEESASVRGGDGDGVGGAPRWAAAGLSEPATTLIVAPYVDGLDDFLMFLCQIERCNEILEELDLVGKLQVATFHPEYIFQGRGAVENKHLTGIDSKDRVRASA
jgi:hypothetical protein